MTEHDNAAVAPDSEMAMRALRPVDVRADPRGALSRVGVSDTARACGVEPRRVIDWHAAGWIPDGYLGTVQGLVNAEVWTHWIRRRRARAEMGLPLLSSRDRDRRVAWRRA